VTVSHAINVRDTSVEGRLLQGNSSAAGENPVVSQTRQVISDLLPHSLRSSNRKRLPFAETMCRKPAVAVSDRFGISVSNLADPQQAALTVGVFSFANGPKAPSLRATGRKVGEKPFHERRSPNRTDDDSNPSD
jgi:hypothetical protein